MANIDIKINPVYMPYLKDDRKYQVYFGGAGSGKSRFVVQKIIMLLLTEKRKCLCVRQTFNSMRDSVFAEFKTVASEMGVYELLRFKEATLAVEFPNGSSIIMKGSDDEQKLLSISGITDCFIEEATEISMEIFDQLILRVREPSKSNHFYIAFNPVSETHWLKSRVVENDELMKDGFVCHSTYKDNMFLPEAYHRAMDEMRMTNPAKYRVYGLGLWGTMGKLVYENWDILNFDVGDLFKQHPRIQQHFGLDFGFMADETAFVYCLVDTDTMEIFIVDELYQKGMLNDKIAKWLFDNGYDRCPIIADSAEQKSIADLRRLGLTKIKPARKGKGSINAGIDLISSFKIHVHPNCVNTINELGSYAYSKDRKTNQYTNKPLDKNNHLMDALRYALEELLGKQSRARTISKSVLGL